MLIPHVGGRRCILDWHYPALERLIEIGSSCRIRLRWGGARIEDRYRRADWKGSITISNAVINAFEGRRGSR